MGTFSGQTLINDLARRLRDTANVGYPRATVLDVLNRCERSINAHLGLVTNTATFVTGNTCLYSVPAIATDIVRIIEIRDGTRLLHKVPWENLLHQDARWLRMKGPQAEVFANIGRDLLAVIPVTLEARTLTAVYVKQTTNMADTAAANQLDLPDEHKSLLLDVAETVLLFRGREFKNMQVVLGRAAKALGMEDAVQIARRIGDPTHQ